MKKVDKAYIIKHLKKFRPIKELKNYILTNIPYKKEVKFDTILITFFNVGINPIAIDEIYLEKRFELFDKYTFPSINAQTDKDFTWFLLFNDKTPEIYKKRIEILIKNTNLKNIKIIYTKYDLHTCTKPYLNKIISSEMQIGEWLLSIRCDNDDMLAKNYIEEAKKNFRPLHNMYIDFIRGYNLYLPTGELNSYKCRSNHFIGYVENTKVRPFETVLNCDHSIAKEFGYMRRIDNKKYPLWCEATHETNQINTFRGVKASEDEQKYFEENFVISKGRNYV